jgi:hypothetical protein
MYVDTKSAHVIDGVSEGVMIELNTLSLALPPVLNGIPAISVPVPGRGVK